MPGLKKMAEDTKVTLKPQEKKVFLWLLENETSLLDLSIQQISSGAGVSDATVVRFCKTLGFSGLKEFKIFYQSGIKRSSLLDRPITWNESDAGVFDLMNAKSAHAVEAAFSEANRERLSWAADLIAAAGDIDVMGVGGSAIIAEYVYKELMRYGKKVNLFTDTYLMMMKRGVQTEAEGNVTVAISCSGENQSILSAAAHAVKSGRKLIAVSNQPESSLAGISDVVLVSAEITGFEDEGDTLSRLSQTAMLNTLALLVALRMGKDGSYRENFTQASNYGNFLEKR